MQRNMVAFPLHEFMYVVNGLLISPAFSFLRVILVLEEFLSRGIYSICNLQLFTEEPGGPEDIIETADTCSFGSPISHKIFKFSNSTDHGQIRLGLNMGHLLSLQGPLQRLMHSEAHKTHNCWDLFKNISKFSTIF